ncbi:hypothetical protein Hanom_Chr02g00135301 [Helianthus anomalus]
MDSRSEEDEKSTKSRNWNYRGFKPPMDGSLDDFDQSGDRSRDAWQHGVLKAIKFKFNPCCGKKRPVISLYWY